MKRISKLLLITLILLFSFGCSNSMKNSVKKVKNVFKEETHYNNIVATFVTTQGDISFFLYPEAAPVTVANFVNLAKRGYYDNTKFTRSVENFMIQGGDPTGTGFGNPGYTIPDEFVDWLDFYQKGMLAMANAGPNTGGSQFFMTFYPADWLNGVHTIFGEIKSESDFLRLRNLEVGDVIKEVTFEGDVDFILSLNKPILDDWNNILDREFPKLKKYPIKPITPEQKLAYMNELDIIYKREAHKESKDFEFYTPKLIRGVFNKIGNYTPREPILSNYQD